MGLRGSTTLDPLEFNEMEGRVTSTRLPQCKVGTSRQAVIPHRIRQCHGYLTPLAAGFQNDAMGGLFASAGRVDKIPAALALIEIDDAQLYPVLACGVFEESIRQFE